MTHSHTDGRAASPAHPASAPRRLLGCIRFDEVAVLQGAPLLGALFASQGFTLAGLLTLAVMIIGNTCLVAHVFVLNDWAGGEGDLKDRRRAPGTYLAKGVSRAAMGYLSFVLLVLALLLFSAVSAEAFIFALVIAALSALYSAPGIHLKGKPLFSTALHLVGGAGHFLLGYMAFAPFSWLGIALACYFGLVFAAGHLAHEVRDYQTDLLNGIRTNAVAFGQRQGFTASVALFTLAYLMLTGLSLVGGVPRLMMGAALFLPLHLFVAWRAFQADLNASSLRRMQRCYRGIHAIIGLAMVAAVLPW